MHVRDYAQILDPIGPHRSPLLEFWLHETENPNRFGEGDEGGREGPRGDVHRRNHDRLGGKTGM